MLGLSSVSNAASVASWNSSIANITSDLAHTLVRGLRTHQPLSCLKNIAHLLHLISVHLFFLICRARLNLEESLTDCVFNILLLLK